MEQVALGRYPQTAIEAPELPSLATWRRQKLWSQRDLARESGVSAATIQQIETGRVQPHVSTMRRLCAALGVDDPRSVNEFRAAIERDEMSEEGKE
jgi:transcriptional regulator with XRE-family HTH domain